MRGIHESQRGSASLKFILVLLVLGALAYIGYLYIPIAYQAHLYKDLMQHDVDVAASQGYKPVWVREQLVKTGPEYGVPANALISAVQRDNRIEVRVQFTKRVEFPGYTHEYNFDHTAKSTAFLTFK